MPYEPPLNDPIFEGEGDDSDMSPDYDTLDEQEGESNE
jgi:hypothetical protein